MKHLFLFIFSFFLMNTYAQSSENDSISLKKNKQDEKELIEAIKGKDYKLAKELLFDISTADFVFDKNGFFVDGMFGFTAARLDSLVDNDVSGLTGSIRFGNKFYLKKSKNSSIGIQITYARLNIVFRDNPNYYSHHISNLRKSSGVPSFSLANIGFTSLVRIGRLSGFEANLDFGHYTTFVDDSVFTGINLNPNFKFRYRKLAFGIDCQIAKIFGGMLSNTFSFSLGAKF